MSGRTKSPDNPPWRVGYMLALALGVLTVAVFYGSFILFAGLPSRAPALELWPYVLLQVMLASLAFGFLARKGIRSKLPWLVAIGLTGAFWSALFVSELASLRDQTGANIGMGWILLISPFLIAGGALLTEKVTSGQ